MNVDTLKSKLSPRAKIFTPDTEGYDEAKLLWNKCHDHVKPAIIVRVMMVPDVVNALSYAKKNNLVVTARSGGHSIPGHSTVEGGVVIDFSAMKGIHVDPENKTVRLQPGVKIEELDHAISYYNLCTPTGTVGDTGVFGLTLGGGLGRLQRMYGFAVDNILEAEVVLSDESVVVCNEEKNSDLLWAIRGAGCNFGIVTSLVLRCYSAPQVYQGHIVYSLDSPKTKETTHNLINYFRNIGSNNNFMDISMAHPPDGKRVLSVELLFYVTPEEGKSIVEKIPLGEPMVNEWRPVSYLEAQKGIHPPGLFDRGHFYMKGGLFSKLSEELLDTVFDIHENSIPGSLVNVILIGGAVFDRSLDKSSYPCKSEYLVEFIGVWPEGDGIDIIRWSNDGYNIVKEHMVGVYYNFNSEWTNSTTENEKVRRLNDTFGPSLPRLLELKEKYDPKNVFRRNFNLKCEESLNKNIIR